MSFDIEKEIAKANSLVLQRPANVQLVYAIASAFNVDAIIAHRWLVEAFANERKAA